MIQYKCNNPKCKIYNMNFRGGAEDTECPMCGSRDVVIVNMEVGHD
jgi:hypothetical protein